MNGRPWAFDAALFALLLLVAAGCAPNSPALRPRTATSPAWSTTSAGATAHGTTATGLLLAFRSGGHTVRVFTVSAQGVALLDTMTLSAPVLAIGPDGPDRALAYVQSDQPGVLGALLTLDFRAGAADALTVHLKTPRSGTAYTGIELSGGRIASTGGLVAASGFHGGGELDVTDLLDASTFTQAHLQGVGTAPLFWNGSCGPQLLAAGAGRFLLGAPSGAPQPTGCLGPFTFGWVDSQHGLQTDAALDAWGQPTVAAALAPNGTLALLGHDGRLWVGGRTGAPHAVAALIAVPPYDKAVPFVAWSGARSLVAETDGHLQAVTLGTGGAATTVKPLPGIDAPDYAVIRLTARVLVPASATVACAINSLLLAEQGVWVRLPPGTTDPATIHVDLSWQGHAEPQTVRLWDAHTPGGAKPAAWSLVTAPEPSDADLGPAPHLPLLVPTATWMHPGRYTVTVGSFQSTFQIGGRCGGATLQGNGG